MQQVRRSHHFNQHMSPKTSLRPVLAGAATLAVFAGSLSFLNKPSSSVWSNALFVTSVIAAETGAAGDEDYSGWDWDEIPIESQGKSVTEQAHPPAAEEKSAAGKTAAPAMAETESAQSAPAAETKKAQAGEATPDPNDTGKASDGELSFDMDWSEGFEIEDAEVGADQNARRRAAREEKMARLANKPRVGSTAEPDFEAHIHEGYQLFPGMRPYTVIPSKKDPDMHPCLDCHDWAQSDLTPRLLKEPHDNFKLQHGLHGKGEFWCLTCHHLEGDGGLKTFEGVKLSFDEAYILCSQCHSQEAKDWAFGAHGKRVDNWRGERRILNCTACHYQHRPTYDPRKPMPKPSLRMGLVRPGHPAQDGTSPEHRHKTVKVWERHTDEH